MPSSTTPGPRCTSPTRPARPGIAPSSSSGPTWVPDPMAGASAGAVERYIELGLALGRHIDGMVDAYYGPRELAEKVSVVPVRSPESLVADGRSLLADLASGATGTDLGPVR